MTLNEYLREHGFSRARFAEQIGVTGEAVRKYAAGERFPKPAIMRRIAKATGGEVDYPDFLAQHGDDEAA